MKTTETELPKLTLLQERFIAAYLGEANGNGTLACKIAGYKGNDNTLGKMAYENLQKTPKISLWIEHRKAELATKSPIDCAWWRRQAVKRFEHCTKLDEAQGRALDETNGKGYLDMLGRNVGAYEADNRQRADKIAIVLR